MMLKAKAIKIHVKSIKEAILDNTDFEYNFEKKVGGKDI